MLATFLHFLQGTPYIYQGEEIGMTNVAFANIEDYRDIATRNLFHEYVEQKGADPQFLMKLVHRLSRDNARTPIQWDNAEHAGFTSGTPWLKVNPNYTTINVEQALADSDSIFYTYQRLIRLRKTYPVICYGAYDLLLEDHDQIYAFTRTLDDERLLIILNFTSDTPVFVLPPELSFEGKELLISNYAIDPAEDLKRLSLRPFEARAYRLT
jgi:oligo-1,6-glucosidase